MSRNVPDDWDRYWTTCSEGHRYHLSEGYCTACEREYDHFGLTEDDFAYWDEDYVDWDDGSRGYDPDDYPCEDD